MESDLEHKIELEVKMREGSARLLAAAGHPAQSLEAARALLTSNERMSAYMLELQRRKRDPKEKTSGCATTGRLSLSDLRFPLMWRDSDHFKNRGDHRRFAVFCLARLGTEIHDTSLVCPIDREHTDISFPDVLVFNNVPPDFELVLEIYSHVLQEDFSIASTPRRIRRTIHSSISKTVGKKLAAALRDEYNSSKIGPQFDLVARARLSLADTDNDVHTHDLVINNFENKHQALPVFGHFCCRLAAQPNCLDKEICAGHVHLNGQPFWACLQNFHVKAWESKKFSEEQQEPMCAIPLNKETSIERSKTVGDEVRIVSYADGAEAISTLKFNSNDEAQIWYKALLGNFKDKLMWRHAADVIQHIPCIESTRNSFVSNRRQGSLYDETPLIETDPPEYSTAASQVQRDFGLATFNPASNQCASSNESRPHRSRAFSAGSSRKFAGISLKSHWTFSSKHQE
ncbi:hypothetical protein KM043_003369 [Ampulex compressa]|nr:hypothetical protein KM043_003369 [Ampulex compressa]